MPSRDPKPSFQDVALHILLSRVRSKLEPAELTALRLALKENYHGSMHYRFDRLLDEIWMEREQKKDTPRKRD